MLDGWRRGPRRLIHCVEMDVHDSAAEQPDMAHMAPLASGTELEAIQTGDTPAVARVALWSQAAQDHTVIKELAPEGPARAPAGRHGGFARAHGIPPPEADRADDDKRQKLVHGDDFEPAGVVLYNAAAAAAIPFIRRPVPTCSHSGSIKAMNESTRTEIEAAAFRRLVTHLRERTDVQNIDLMELAGFCRNCLAKWYQGAAQERGVDLDYEAAREIVYGMPYKDWKDKHQTERPVSDGDAP